MPYTMTPSAPSEEPPLYHRDTIPVCFYSLQATGPGFSRDPCKGFPGRVIIAIEDLHLVCRPTYLKITSSSRGRSAFSHCLATAHFILIKGYSEQIKILVGSTRQLEVWNSRSFFSWRASGQLKRLQNHITLKVTKAVLEPVPSRPPRFLGSSPKRYRGQCPAEKTPSEEA